MKELKQIHAAVASFESPCNDLVKFEKKILNCTSLLSKVKRYSCTRWSGSYSMLQTISNNYDSMLPSNHIVMYNDGDREWLIVYARVPGHTGPQVQFWDLFFVENSSSETIKDEIVEFYKRDCIYTQNLVSWDSDGASDTKVSLHSRWFAANSKS